MLWVPIPPEKTESAPASSAPGWLPAFGYRPLSRSSVGEVGYNGCMNRALFLDRDGVIIENRADYVRRWEDVEFIEGALRALAVLSQAQIKVILVTNQSAVGRGMISMEAALLIHERILKEIDAAGGRVDDTFMCPHAPQDNCLCRKPKPGLFLQAAGVHRLDLAQSICIGDALTDLEAAHAAGVGVRILVRTGRGAKQHTLPEARTLPPFLVFETLAEAVDHFPPSFLPDL